MVERIIKQWNADPNGEMVVTIYQVSGVKVTVRRVFQPTRNVDVPSGVSPHCYEPVPLTLKANQRVEVVQGEKVVMKA